MATTTPLFRPHLGTGSPAEAVKFCCPLFGWTFLLNDEAPSSISFFRGSREVITGFPRVHGFEGSTGGCYPAFWVESVSTHATRAVSLGARIVTRDTTEHRSTVMASPTGEVFGLIERPKPRDAGTGDAVLELVTPDPLQTGRFYEELFGFRSASPDGHRELYAADGTRVAAISELHENWDDRAFLNATGRDRANRRSDVPPHWMVYFQVGDLGDTLSRAEFLGASLVVQHELEPELTPAALVQDPAGHFWSLVGQA
jgi:predicted enzyme related to lactoylglutathione lyase